MFNFISVCLKTAEHPTVSDTGFIGLSACVAFVMKVKHRNQSPAINPIFYMSEYNPDNESYNDATYRDISLNNNHARSEFIHSVDSLSIGKAHISQPSSQSPIIARPSSSKFNHLKAFVTGLASSVEGDKNSSPVKSATSTNKSKSNPAIEDVGIPAAPATLSNQALETESLSAVDSFAASDQHENSTYGTHFTNQIPFSNVENINALSYGSNTSTQNQENELSPQTENHSPLAHSQIQYSYQRNMQPFHQTKNAGSVNEFNNIDTIDRGSNMSLDLQQSSIPFTAPSNHIPQSFSTPFFPLLDHYTNQLALQNLYPATEKGSSLQHFDHNQYNLHLHNHFYRFNGDNANFNGQSDPHLQQDPNFHAEENDLEKKPSANLIDPEDYSHVRTQSNNQKIRSQLPHQNQRSHSSDLVQTCSNSHKHQNSTESAVSLYSNKSSNSVMSRKSSGTTIQLINSAHTPNYYSSKAAGQTIFPHLKPKIATTYWDDEKTICYQVEGHGILVSRREDNNYINGTKLLNVAGMTRGKRDGILKQEKIKSVIKIGLMNLKGVWIPYERAFEIARNEGIDQILYPLFKKNLKEFFISEGSYLKKDECFMASPRDDGFD